MASPPESALSNPATSHASALRASSAMGDLAEIETRNTPLAILPTDGELLMLFTQEESESAFDRLVERHGGMVWRVCRSILLTQQDVEDAYQATFLLLASKANQIRANESAAGWLYRVAYRTALSAKRRAKRRREESLEAEPAAPPEEAFPDLIGRQMVSLLLEELKTMPKKYQTPLVMRYLEGQSRRAIADQTDMTVAAVQGKLSRGKQLLRRRLVRRGVSLSIAMSVVGAAGRSTEAASPALIAKTAADCHALVAGSGSIAASSAVLALYQEGTRAMLFASMTKPASALVACSLAAALWMGSGAGGNELTNELPSDGAAFQLSAELDSDEIADEAPAANLKLAQRQMISAPAEPVAEQLKTVPNLVKEINAEKDSLREKREIYGATLSELNSFDALALDRGEKIDQESEELVKKLRSKLESIDQQLLKLSIDEAKLILSEEFSFKKKDLKSQPVGRSIFAQKRPTPENGLEIERWPSGELKAERDYVRGQLVAAKEYSEEGWIVYEMQDTSPVDSDQSKSPSPLKELPDTQMESNSIRKTIQEQLSFIPGVKVQVRADLIQDVLRAEASIVVPRSYVDSVANQKMGDKKLSDQDRQATQSELQGKIEEIAKPLLPRLPSGEDEYKQVSVVFAPVASNVMPNIKAYRSPPAALSNQKVVVSPNGWGSVVPPKNSYAQPPWGPTQNSQDRVLDAPPTQSNGFVSEAIQPLRANRLQTNLQSGWTDSPNQKPAESKERYFAQNKRYGYSVAKLQEALNKHLKISPTTKVLGAMGLATTELDVDGDYGPRTEAAVREFQTQSNLPTTGFADAVTRKALGLTDKRIEKEAAEEQKEPTKEKVELEGSRLTTKEAIAAAEQILKERISKSSEMQSKFDPASESPGRSRVINNRSEFNRTGWTILADAVVGNRIAIPFPELERKKLQPQIEIIEVGEEGCRFRFIDRENPKSEKYYALYSNLSRLDDFLGMRIHTVWVNDKKDQKPFIIIRNDNSMGRPVSFGSHDFARHYLDNPNEVVPLPMPDKARYNLQPAPYSSELEQENQQKERAKANTLSEGTKPAEVSGNWRCIHEVSALNSVGWVTIAEMTPGNNPPLLLPGDRRPRPHVRIIKASDAACTYTIEGPGVEQPGKQFPLQFSMPSFQVHAGQKVSLRIYPGPSGSKPLLVIRHCPDDGRFHDGKDGWKLANQLLHGKRKSSNLKSQANPKPSVVPASQNPQSTDSVDTEVHVVGTYSGADGAPLTVKVLPTEKPITLVLSAYYFQDWHLEVDPAAKLHRVIVAGYFGQRIEGILDSLPEGTSLDVLSYFETKKARIDSELPDGMTPREYFWAYKKTSEEYFDLEEKVQSLTGGKPIQNFYGAYKANEFVVGGKAETAVLESKEKTVKVSTQKPVADLSIDELNQRGWQAFYQGKNQEAEADFREILSRDKNHLAAINGLGFALLNQGNHQEAKPLFKKHLKRDKKAIGPMNGLARCLKAEGDLDAAIKVWEMGTKIAPGPTALSSGLAFAYCEKEEYAKAIPVFEMLVKSDPKNTFYSDALAKAKEARGEQPKATTSNGSAEVPRIIERGDGKADGRKSLGGSGHLVKFTLPEGVTHIRAVRIHGSRYGTKQAPREDFEISFLSEDRSEILAVEHAAYGLFRKGKEKWNTIRLPQPIELPKTFWVALDFNPGQTKGIYLSYDTKTRGEYSMIGLAQEEPTEHRPVGAGGDWMVGLLPVRD